MGLAHILTSRGVLGNNLRSIFEEAGILRQPVRASAGFFFVVVVVVHNSLARHEADIASPPSYDHPSGKIAFF